MGHEKGDKVEGKGVVYVERRRKGERLNGIEVRKMLIQQLAWSGDRDL